MIKIKKFSISKKNKQKISNYFSLVAAGFIISVSLISFLLPKDQFQILKEKLMTNPNDFQARLQLAEKFLTNNQFPEAEKELLFTQEAGNSAQSTLETQTRIQLERLWQQKHSSDPKDIQKLIAAWEKIVAKKPNYRDGWLQLAVLHYKIFENNQAKNCLQKAIDLDPNFKLAKELEKIISK